MPCGSSPAAPDKQDKPGPGKVKQSAMQMRFWISQKHRNTAGHRTRVGQVRERSLRDSALACSALTFFFFGARAAHNLKAPDALVETSRSSLAARAFEMMRNRPRIRNSIE